MGSIRRSPSRGLDLLRRRWEAEAAGLLSLAVAAAALRRYEAPAAAVAARRLEAFDPAGADTVALAWATIALGPGLRSLEVP